MESVRYLIDAYFLQMPLPEFDYSKIRKAGEASTCVRRGGEGNLSLVTSLAIDGCIDGWDTAQVNRSRASVASARAARS